MVNLCDFPARITSWRLPAVPISQAMEQSKKPGCSPSTTRFSMSASTSAIWPRCARVTGEIGASRIVQESLHIFDGCGERQRRDRPAMAIKGNHVIPARRTITEDENLAPALGAKVDEVVAGAAQKAREIEIARLESRCCGCPTLVFLSSKHYTLLPKKKHLCDALTRH